MAYKKPTLKKKNIFFVNKAPQNMAEALHRSEKLARLAALPFSLYKAQKVYNKYIDTLFVLFSLINLIYPTLGEKYKLNKLM